MKKLIRLLGLLLLAVAPAAAHAEWRAAETAHFIIYSESSDRDIARLAERLERIDGLMRMATGISGQVEPVKVRIYEVATTAQIERALGMANTGIAGFYDSNILGPFAVTPRKTFFGTSLFGPELVLHHEYAHHFMLQYFPSVYPSWYVEGFAELIGSSKILEDGKVGYGLPARHRGGEIAAYWVPLDELLLKPPHKVRNLDLYAQGWALTHFLTFSNERAPQLREYLRALRAGRSPEEAAKAFGDLATLNREARRYVLAGDFPYKAVPVPVEQPVVRSTRTLSPGEAALIPEVIAFRDDDLLLYRKDRDREREQRERQETLARIRDKASRFANDSFALHFLAEAEYAAGHYPASEAAADRLLALHPDHVRGLVRKALNLVQTARSLDVAARGARIAEARRLALRANRADPKDALPLLAYFQTYQLVGEAPPKAALNGLARVVEALPSYIMARQLLVDQLAAEKRWAEAIGYLQPIANSTHESPRREAARQQMEKLRAELAKERGEPQDS